MRPVAASGACADPTPVHRLADDSESALNLANTAWRAPWGFHSTPKQSRLRFPFPRGSWGSFLERIAGQLFEKMSGREEGRLKVAQVKALVFAVGIADRVLETQEKCGGSV